MSDQDSETRLDGSNRRGGSRDYRRPTSRNSGLLPFAGPAIVASIAYMTRAISPPISRRAPDTAICSCGGGAGQCHRHAVSGLSPSSALSRQESGRAVPRSFPAPVVYAMWRERNRRHGDRSRRVSRSFHRPEPVVWLAAVLEFGDCWRRHIRHVGAARLGFRPIEVLIAGFVSVIGVSYLIELAIAPPIGAPSPFIPSYRAGRSA